MRLAYEVHKLLLCQVTDFDGCIKLGFTNASVFTRGSVRFLSLDGISFARPVPIGSILRLTSHILHTSSLSQTRPSQSLVVSLQSYPDADG
jgi:hypothetical protein